MINIRLLNKISQSGLAGFTAEYQVGADVENPDGIIVRSAAMHDMPLPSSLAAIARAGAGTNNIPIEKCSEAGICVFNTPGANANAVKELAVMALMLSSRKIFAGLTWVQTLKGKGDAVPKLVEEGKSQFAGPEVAGKTLGLVGVGTIGLLVANAAIHLGMKVLGYDPYLSVEGALKLEPGVKLVKNLDELYAASDYISLHLPATAETKGMINAAAIASMKKGARIINFARGELVNDADLLAALETGGLSCYVADFPNDALLGNPGVIALPHLGASTPESEENCAVMAVDEIRDFFESGSVRNSINFPTLQAAKTQRARVAVLYKAEAATPEAIAAALGNVAKTAAATRGKLGYALLDVDGEANAAKAGAVAGVIRARVIV